MVNERSGGETSIEEARQQREIKLMGGCIFAITQNTDCLCRKQYCWRSTQNIVLSFLQKSNLLIVIHTFKLLRTSHIGADYTQGLGLAIMLHLVEIYVLRRPFSRYMFFGVRFRGKRKRKGTIYTSTNSSGASTGKHVEMVV